MTESLYDRPDFFAAYARLPRSEKGLEAAPEWPALQALLPEMAGKRVLDLGCGYGSFARWAMGQGAESVLALDVSTRMLERAAALTEGEGIEYRQGDLEALDIPIAAFDLVFSSLAFHYVVELPDMLRRVHAAMAPKGVLVFSQEHPLLTAPSNPGWITPAEGQRVWALDDYLEDGPRVTDWLAPGVVKQHRGLGTLVNALIGAGFTLTKLEEWSPSPAQLEAEPDWAEERDRPSFLLVKAAN
ncbi:MULTISPECIES: class I SAM-dependent methyltransferase [Roseomonadaceae]|uniref:Class I SAM-dependent methyltransferase n=1 Tax=Falsiroseomonas oleicola TaxID=2801474 RepID=A0ABS6HCR9_9PROT|nr:class I SAM-dependent methyltransferase [Roseomonas oleicola]MBU8546510.1 class I SAM-dependent methyltransferase [Roseomonas oleicola]